MKDFRTLKEWLKAHQLALAIYQTTQNFPPEALNGLTDQLRSVSLSIPSTIAEGYSRGNSDDLYSFLQLAMSSATEVEYYLLLAHDLTYLTSEEYECLNHNVDELKQMITTKIHKLSRQG